MTTKKTKSTFDATVIQRAMQQRYNPLPNLTPELVTAWHAAFRRGNLRAAALAWESIMNSDDMVITVAPKREKAVSRHGFEIITTEDTPKAKAHAETLEKFYNNLVATNAIDLNERGGFPMLVRQMMKSVGMKYANHEIIWKPGEVFSAEFRYVPLWFFENTTGKLRFLKNGSGLSGEDMQPGEWMTTTGDGIMAACTACYLFKHLPLQDWLIFSERYGLPVVWGESTDSPGSPGWESMEGAISGISGGEEVVVSAGSRINVEEFKSQGNLPFAALIERMDRAIAAMWCGGDLSTMSKKDGVGSNVQDEESDILENDDARNITDVLNEQVDRFVIRYVHGDTVPLALVRVKENIKQDVKLDLEIDEGLREAGFEEPVEEVQKRYNRPHLVKPEAGNLKPEDEAMAVANENPSLWGRFLRLVSASNEKQPSTTDEALSTLKKNSRTVITQATAEDLQPLAASLADLLDNTDDADLADALQEWRENTLPDLTEQLLSDPAAAIAWEDSLTAAALNGFLEESE